MRNSRVTFAEKPQKKINSKKNKKKTLVFNQTKLFKILMKIWISILFKEL